MKRLIIILALAALACGQPVAAVGMQAANAPPPTSVPEPTETPTAVSTRTICGAVNVRKVPAAEGAVLGWLVKGKVVTVYSTDAGWVRISPLTESARWITAEALCQ